ncbi:uncharacterized protein LOC129943317 [Eupeodes corollae]|uniref:uncharacterized protein LOC129943317 n=1 Tax=Eupeodes corollae TaxID=290404 RepID=UPI002493896C|nr:uncharacterized protein LOC129943317 [Eupeodes corollae]
MNEANPVSTPAESITYKDTDKIKDEVQHFPYREAVGSLMYLEIGSRPDISYALGVASRHLDKPTTQDITAVKRIIRYVKGTRLLGICFKSNNKLIVSCFSDADYGGDTETRRSTSGFVFLLGHSPISWSSQRQQCVALSTMEAEYIAGANAVKEIVWLLRLMNDLLEEGCGKPSLYWIIKVPSN